MSRSDQPDLTPEQYREIIELAREGIPLAVIARKFHVTKNCLYMRKARGGEVGTELQAAVIEARADYVIGLHRKMRQMAEDGVGTWTGLARLLQWSGDDYQTPSERAAVALDKERLKALRETKPADEKAVVDQSIAKWQAARATLPTAPVGAPADAPPSAPGAPVDAPAGTVAAP